MPGIVSPIEIKRSRRKKKLWPIDSQTNKTDTISDSKWKDNRKKNRQQCPSENFWHASVCFESNCIAIYFLHLPKSWCLRTRSNERALADSHTQVCMFVWLSDFFFVFKSVDNLNVWCMGNFSILYFCDSGCRFSAVKCRTFFHSRYVCCRFG